MVKNLPALTDILSEPSINLKTGLGVGVAVGVGVFVGTGVAVGAGVFVGIGVAVGVGVFVGTEGGAIITFLLVRRLFMWDHME